MAQQFAKIDANLDTHPKIREAGRNGREVFMFVLRANAKLGRHGSISSRHVRERYLADILMMTEAEASEGLRRAVEAELLAVNGDEVVIVGWDQDWARGPVDGAERTKKWRDKTVTPPMSPPVTVTKCDEANVTESHRDACDASEKSREEEKRVHTERADKPRRGRPKSPKTSLPADWAPSSEAVDLARREGLNLDREASRFRDGALANGREYSDWNAAFRNWLTSEYQKPKAGPQARLGLETIRKLEVLA